MYIVYVYKTYRRELYIAAVLYATIHYRQHHQIKIINQYIAQYQHQLELNKVHQWCSNGTVTGDTR